MVSYHARGQMNRDPVRVLFAANAAKARRWPRFVSEYYSRIGDQAGSEAPPGVGIG